MSAQVVEPAGGDEPLPPLEPLTDEEVLVLTDEEFELYLRALEADRMERTAVEADPGSPGLAYANDPVGWAQDIRQVFLWSLQREVARALVIHKRVAVKSCHGVGKTFLAGGVLIPWWVDSHPIGSARVLSTAPSNDQVRTLLWHEVNQAHAAGGLPGRVNQTEWWIDTTMVAFGRKPDDKKPGAMVGLHSEFNLIVLDEADGVADALWTAANALATNESSRILAIGNPDTAGSRFEKVCRPGSGWHVITISAFDSPNFTDEPVPDKLRRVLVDQSYVDSMVKDHGVDSPEYSSKVLGEFPESNANTVIPKQILARAREARPVDPDTLTPVVLGVDVGAGGDRSVIRTRRGFRLTSEVWRSRHDDPLKLQEEILEAQRITQASEVHIDANGVGWAVAGHIQRALNKRALQTGKLVKVYPIHTGGGSTDPKRFKNLRAESWWLFRELCQDQSIDLQMLDDDDPLLEELVEPRWSQDAFKRIVIEKKDEVRKRLERSPDDADAAILAFTIGTADLASSTVTVGRRWGQGPSRR